MSLSGREIFMVLRARDEASRTLKRVSSTMSRLDADAANAMSKADKEARAAIRQRGHDLMEQGAAVTSVGVAMTYMGIQGVKAMVGLAKTAADYNQESSKTLTQVDDTRIKLNDVAKAGLNVARTVPVAFEEIQPALYDIFSSIDVNMKQSRILLKQFAKDAVGGQADMAVATEANLAIMNAYKIKTKDVTKVSDFMFQLVRKGVGTYTDFAHSIGQAIPSAVRLGVSLDQLGGVLTFMTRNGLNAARASTSAARAFDALSNPKTADNLQALGVQIRDTKGELKPFPEIMDLMAKRMQGMNKFAKSSFLKEAFGGSGGTIQAMRFFNLAFNNMDQFHKRMKEMQNDSGAAADAYKTMAKTPEAQFKLLQNRLKVVGVTLGNDLLPILVKGAQWLDNIVSWFDRLPASTKKDIVILAALAAALTTLLGILTTLAGSLMIVRGAMIIMSTASATAGGSVRGMATGLGIMAAGMVTAHKATSGAAKAVGILTSAAGGAVAGATFGPWGAAIGGAVGALGGWISSMHSAGTDVDKLKAKVSDYTDTLNQQSGALTKLAKKQVLADLQKSGAISQGLKMGISPKTTLSAALGNPQAIELINKKLQGTQDKVAGLKKQIKDLQNVHMVGGLGAGSAASQRNAQIDKLKNKLKDLQDPMTKFANQLNGEKAALQRDGETIRQNAQALQNVKKALDGVKFPKKMVSKLQVEGFDKSMDQLLSLAKQYKLTPKQVKVLAKAEGFDIPIKKAKDIVKNLKLVNNTKADIHTYASSLDGQIKRIQSSAHAGMVGVGSNMTSGIMVGLSPFMSKVVSTITNGVNAGIAAGHRAADAHSPSRKMIKLGHYIMDGLIKGIGDRQPSLNKLLGAVSKSMVGPFKKDMKRAVENATKDTLKRLQKLGKRIKQQQDLIKAATSGSYSDLTAKEKKLLTKKQKKILQAGSLQDLRQQKADYVSAVKDAVNQAGGIAGLSSQTDVFGNATPITAANISTYLQQQLATIKQWGVNLKTILKLYGKNVYDQIVQMGPVDGAAYADALVHATPSQVQTIKATTNAISSQANTIAASAGSSMYDAGIKAAEGLIKGLQSKEKSLQKQAKKMGQIIAKEIKKALKQRSPSKVGIDIGANFGGSIGMGMMSQHKTVTKASRALAQAASAIRPEQTFSRTPVVGASGGYAVSGDYIHQEITVHTQEIDPRVTAAQLGWQLANYR